MHRKTSLIIILILALMGFACRYIVLPDELEDQRSAVTGSWSAVATKVGESENGALRIDLTIRNETGLWSMMRATANTPAKLTSGDGSSSSCATVVVGTGGHRLAPGFQMRGYLTRLEGEISTQLLHVECEAAEPAAGSRLAVNYEYFLGDLDYYHQEDGMVSDVLEVDLDQIAADVTYPVFEQVEGLIQPADVEITAISQNVITLLGTERTDTGLQFTWQNYNPTEFALKTHIGTPPVIGEAGIIYGIFQIMDIVSVPLTPAGGSVSWTTDVEVPADEKGFYILLSVESKQMRLYVNYALDITDK